jgi:hypothetical protein
MAWLASNGSAQGWRPLPNATRAQRSVNQGNLVVVVVENPNSSKSRHIAIVRPGTPDVASVAAENSDATQDGGTSVISIPLAQGFGHHHDAYPYGVRYFEHPISA